MTLPLTKLMGAALLTLTTTAAFSAAPVVGAPTQTTPTAPILIAPTMTPQLQVVPKPAPTAAQYVIRPKLTGITLTPNVYAPGQSITLTMNLTGDLKATNCKFVANVHSVPTADNPLSQKMNPHPLGTYANLPHNGLNLAIGTIHNQGKYRVDLIAAHLTGETPGPLDCDGIASAEFEIKRQKMNAGGVGNITGLYVAPNGYDKTNKIWNVDIKGQSTDACNFLVQFKHDASGKIFDNSLTTTLPTGWGFSGFYNEPPYGDYTVTVKGLNNGHPGNVPCTGSASAKTYRDVPADALRITNTNMNLTVSGKKLFYPNNASVFASELTAIDITPEFTKGFVGQQGCTYSIKVAKGGQELVLPFHSSAYPSIYPAVKQKFGISAGDYTFTVVSTPADYMAGSLSCLGGATNKLTVTDKTTITAVSHNWGTCAYGPPCQVTITTTFSGNSSCAYAMSIQKAGHAATVFPLLIHNPGQTDEVKFNYYNGPTPLPAAVYAQLKAEKYFIKVYPAAGVAGCAGEVNYGPYPLMQ